MLSRRVSPLFLAFLIWTSVFACPQTAAAAAPAPGEGKMDWIRLASGEWLAGQLKFMRNEDIEFDSDKLDVLHLKWEDVIELRCSRVLAYAFTEQRLATGPATMRDSVIRVQENGQVQEFRAQELLSIIEGQGSEWDLWSGNFSLGFVARTGNTDQLDYNSLGFVRRDGAISRVDFRYAGNFGELEGTRSINNQLGSTESVLGTDGTISRNQQIRYLPQKVNRPDGVEILGSSKTAPHAHMQNFLDCIRSGSEPNCPFDLGYRVSIACRMAVESYRNGRKVHWDMIREEIV
jgi:hypothetical protein